MLYAFLYSFVLEQLKREEEINNMSEHSKEAQFGNQIRSYILAPYQLVKDMRTGYEHRNPERVLNGEGKNERKVTIAVSLLCSFR